MALLALLPFKFLAYQFLSEESSHTRSLLEQDQRILGGLASNQGRTCSVSRGSIIQYTYVFIALTVVILADVEEPKGS